MVEFEKNSDGASGQVNVTRDLTGWEVREERSAGDVRVAHYSDWHRVERALRTIELARTAGTVRSSLP